MRYSILITAFREAETIGKAIESFLSQLPEDAEILVICPDPETKAVADDFSDRYPALVRHVQDPQKGKPHALNIGLKEAMGDIVVLSDGDVALTEDALAPLLAPFEADDVGAVSGGPTSISPRNTLLGYWSHLLAYSVHKIRLARDQKGDFLDCSGYLYAFRRELIEWVPEDALAEDAVISHLIAQKGYRIRYSPRSRALVKYPTTYEDWLKQKVRSAGGSAQDYVRKSPLKMRSAWLEMISGTWLALSFPRNLREMVWTACLFGARLHLWLLVFINVRIRQRPLATLWKRVETTK